MVEVVHLKALRSWHNDEFEGQMSFGREFVASEMRARELIRLGLAERIPALRGKVVDVAADDPDPEPVETKRPLSEPRQRRGARS